MPLMPLNAIVGVVDPEIQRIVDSFPTAVNYPTPFQPTPTVFGEPPPLIQTTTIPRGPDAPYTGPTTLTQPPDDDDEVFDNDDIPVQGFLSRFFQKNEEKSMNDMKELRNMEKYKKFDSSVDRNISDDMIIGDLKDSHLNPNITEQNRPDTIRDAYESQRKIHPGIKPKSYLYGPHLGSVFEIENVKYLILGENHASSSEWKHSTDITRHLTNAGKIIDIETVDAILQDINREFDIILVGEINLIEDALIRSRDLSGDLVDRRREKHIFTGKRTYKISTDDRRKLEKTKDFFSKYVSVTNNEPIEVGSIKDSKEFAKTVYDELTSKIKSIVKDVKESSVEFKILNALQLKINIFYATLKNIFKHRKQTTPINAQIYKIDRAYDIVGPDEHWYRELHHGLMGIYSFNVELNSFMKIFEFKNANNNKVVAVMYNGGFHSQTVIDILSNFSNPVWFRKNDDKFDNNIELDEDFYNIFKIPDLKNADKDESENYPFFERKILSPTDPRYLKIGKGRISHTRKRLEIYAITPTDIIQYEPSKNSSGNGIISYDNIRMPSYGEGFLDYFQYALPAVVAANSGYEIYKHSKEKKPNKTAMIKNAIIGSLAIGDIYGRMNQLQHEVETNVITARQAQAEGRQILAEAGDQLGLLHDVEMFENQPPIDFGGPPTTIARQPTPTTMARQPTPTTMARQPTPIDFGGPPPQGPPPPPPDFFTRRPLPTQQPMETTTMARQPSPTTTGPTTLTTAPAARPPMADFLSGITKGKKLRSRATAMTEEEIAPVVPIRKQPMDMFDAILAIGEENKAKAKSGLSIDEQLKLNKAEKIPESVRVFRDAMAKMNRVMTSSPAVATATEKAAEDAEWAEDISQADQDAARAARQGQLLIQAEEDARRAIERGTKKAGPPVSQKPKKGKGIKGLKELIEEHARIVAELKPLTKEYKIQKKELEKYRRKKY